MNSDSKSSEDQFRNVFMKAVKTMRQTQKSKIRHEDQFLASIDVTGALAGGGMKSIEIELARTLEMFDADGRYIPDPLPNVIRRAADALEEKLSNGEVSALDISCLSVMKTAVRSITQGAISQAEISAGIPPSL